MKPTIGQFVIIYLNGGGQLSGNVLVWENGAAVLDSPNKTVKTVISDLDKKILYYKIIEISEQKELLELPKKSPDDIRKLAELKQELNNLEREDIRQQFSSHQISNPKSTTYGLPNSLKIHGAPQYPIKETPSQDTGIDGALQNLFRPKTHH